MRGRPPSWISMSGYNFGIDQHFAPNLVPGWKITRPTGPIAKKSKIADGRHLGFRFWAVISSSLNIIAPNFVH